MKLATYLHDGVEGWGLVVADPDGGEDVILDPARAAEVISRLTAAGTSGFVASRPRFLQMMTESTWPTTLVDFLAAGDDAMAALERLATFLGHYLQQSDRTVLVEAGQTVSDIQLLAPVPRPRLLWGLVTNSPSFMRNNLAVKHVNLIPLGHQRPQGSVVGPSQPVVMKNGHHDPFMAFNVELAVVIGKQGRYIPLESAMEHVAGYTTVNDVSGTYYFSAVPGNDRRGYHLPEGYTDWHFQGTASWGGKIADTMCPMGPYLVTKEEVGDPYNLLVHTRQSGRTRDRSHTAGTLMGIERVIHWYSSFATLYPGDIIHFGTMGVDGLQIAATDLADHEHELEVEVERVGALRNPVVIDRGDPRPLDEHASYAVRQLAAAGPSIIDSPADWQPRDARHLYTSFGNDRVTAARDGFGEVVLPRFFNGPSSALTRPDGEVEVPPRATDLLVGIELAVVLRTLATDVTGRDVTGADVTGADVTGADEVILGWLPLISVCDLSIQEEVVEPARVGEHAIPSVYGRWADGFNIAGHPVPQVPPTSGADMTIEIGDRSAHASTADYIHDAGDLIRTISAMTTLFPGDVVTLGSTSARLRVSRAEYAAGLEVRGNIEGLGPVATRLVPHT